jgi:hypothetical protein
LGGSSSTVAFDLDVDGDENVYAGGEFWGTVDFDPGSGVKNKTASGFTADAFLLKLDSNGNYKWVNIIIGSNNDWVRSVDIGNEGNVEVSGAFESTTDFDAGAGVYNLTSKGNYDMFIASYSLDAGVFNWAISCGGTSNDQCYGFDVSETGDCFLTGFFSGSVDFDPGPGSFLIDAGSSSDIFFLQLNNAGLYKQAYGFGSTTGGGTGLAVYADAAGRITMGGAFENTVDFDPGAGVFSFTSINTTSDCFVVQFNSCIPIETNLSTTICDGDSVFADGNFQTVSGEYIDYFISSAGCDSIVTLNLTVLPAITTNISASICEGDFFPFNGNNISESGIYSGSFIATNGCDSLVILNLNVIDINASIFQNGDTLFANGNGTVQWIFCETGLPASEDNNNFFIPTLNGWYAAIITNGFCSDTTECAPVFTGINSFENESDVRIFPNPATDQLTIQIRSESPQTLIQLRNTLGVIIKEMKLSSHEYKLNLENIIPGVYLIYVIQGETIFVEKILKE